jgi:hypothetical protein
VNKQAYVHTYICWVSGTITTDIWIAETRLCQWEIRGEYAIQIVIKRALADTKIQRDMDILCCKHGPQTRPIKAEQRINTVRWTKPWVLYRIVRNLPEANKVAMTRTIRGTTVIIPSSDYNIIFVTWFIKPAQTASRTAWIRVTQQASDACCTLRVSLPIISPGGCSVDYVSRILHVSQPRPLYFIHVFGTREMRYRQGVTETDFPD